MPTTNRYKEYTEDFLFRAELYERMTISIMKKIPYEDIQTLFLDVGNTLISMNFDWVCSELHKLGIACEPRILQRAEAAARPIISVQADKFKENGGAERYERYLKIVLAQLPEEVLSGESQILQVARKLVPILWSGNSSKRLWTYVLPGVREALPQLKAKGLQLVVVSNADGTIEEGLVRQQLRSYFDVVIDSHVVGVEKPDPEIFQIALERSGAFPERTLHVGDMYTFDVIGAWSAGLHAMLLDPYSDWHDVDCDRLPDLIALVEKM